MIRKAVTFRKDESGAMLVEAALVLPVLVIIFLAMVEFSNAFAVQRRVEAVARAAADLVAQTSGVTSGDLVDVSRIGGHLLRPYRAEPLQLRISAITLDENGATVVAWSYGNGLPARAVGSAFSGAPTQVMSAGAHMIVAETSYVHTPILGSVVFGGTTFTSRAFFRPRLTETVEYSR